MRTLIRILISTLILTTNPAMRAQRATFYAQNRASGPPGVFIDTTFNEASAGTNLAGTTPSVCANGCVGPWTLASGTDFTYQTGGGVASSTINPNYDLINSGTVDGVMRFNLSTCTGVSYDPCAFILRYVDANNYIVIYAFNSGAGSPFTQVYDTVAGVQTQIGSNISGAVIDSYTVTYTGSSITVANGSGSTGGTTANTTGTKVGIAIGSSTMEVESFSVKSS